MGKKVFRHLSGIERILSPFEAYHSSIGHDTQASCLTIKPGVRWCTNVLMCVVHDACLRCSSIILNV